MKFNIRHNYHHQKDEKESKKNKYLVIKIDER